MNFSRFIILLSLVFLGFSCNNSKQASSDHSVNSSNQFGDPIDAANALSIGDLVKKMEGSNSTEMKAKVSGQVNSVCQMKGCWMTMKRPDDQEMRVRFKDYAFFVPKDLGGKDVVIEGIAKVDTTSVEMLRHYAEDEGLPQTDIDKITEPEISISFMADGVLIK